MTVRAHLLLFFLAVRLQGASPLVDGVSFEVGVSVSHPPDVFLQRLGVQRTWQRRWFTEGATRVEGFWDLSLGYWNNRTRNRTYASLTDLGFTPTFRLRSNSSSATSPYLEAGIGLHFLSHASLTHRFHLGSSFQFGDHVGAGMTFGRRRIYDLGVRFQHLSNGGIRSPNPGINHSVVRLAIQF